MSFFSEQETTDGFDIDMSGIDDDEFISGFLVDEFKTKPAPKPAPAAQAEEPKQQASAQLVVIPESTVPKQSKKEAPVHKEVKARDAFLINMPVTFMSTNELINFMDHINNLALFDM